MCRQAIDHHQPGFTADASLYRSPRHYRTVGRGRAPGARLTAAAAYDPRWPLLFQEEQRRIVTALGAAVVSVEHVGSSSVPGLDGRPEIDVLVGVGVGDAADIGECARVLDGLGYETTDQPPTPSDGWVLMMKPGQIPFELLVVEHNGPLWTRHLGFRDLLRDDPARAAAYGRLKARWAARYGSDTQGYKKEKQRFWTSVGERLDHEMTQPRRAARGGSFPRAVPASRASPGYS